MRTIPKEGDYLPTVQSSQGKVNELSVQMKERSNYFSDDALHNFKSGTSTNRSLVAQIEDNQTSNQTEDPPQSDQLNAIKKFIVNPPKNDQLRSKQHSQASKDIHVGDDQMNKHQQDEFEFNAYSSSQITHQFVGETTQRRLLKTDNELTITFPTSRKVEDQFTSLIVPRPLQKHKSVFNQRINQHNNDVLRKRVKYFTQLHIDAEGETQENQQKQQSHLDSEQPLFANTFEEIYNIQKSIRNLGESVGFCRPSILNIKFLHQIEEKNKIEEINDFNDDQNNSTKTDSKIKIFRRRLHRFLLSPLYRFLMIILCLANIVAMALHDYSGRLDPLYENKTQNSIASNLELASEIIFILEIILELFARRFFLGKYAFFKNPWLVCNLISIVSGGISLFDSLPNWLGIIFKVLSMLRPLRIIQMISPLRIQFERLLRSLPKINLSFWRLIIFMAFYCVIGLNLFSGALEYRCRVTDDPPSSIDTQWEIFEDLPYLCGSWECPEKAYCNSPADFGRPFDSTEVEIEDMNYGFTNFDNFGNSFFTVFHITRIISWGRITFMYWRRISTFIVTSYFLSLVFICSYILSNIILAELYESFEEQSSIKSYSEYSNHNQFQAEEKQVTHKVNFKEIEVEYSKQKKEEILESIALNHIQLTKNNFNIGEGHSDTSEGPRNNLGLGTKLEHSIEPIQEDIILETGFQEKKEEIADFQKSEKNESQENKGENNIITSNHKFPKKSSLKNSIQSSHILPTSQQPMNRKYKHLRIKFIELFFIFSKLCILVDIIVICSDTADLSSNSKKILIFIDWVLQAVFFLEMVFKGVLLKGEMLSSHLNKIDCLIFIARVILSNISLTFRDNPSIFESHDWIHGAKAIYVFRIFQIVFTTKFLGSVKVLIQNFFDTLSELLYYILIIAFYCSLFALIGYDLFAHTSEFINKDKIPSDLKSGDPPRVNFDTFLNSLESIVYCVLNESWNTQMYNYMRSLGNHVSTFWIIIISTGEIFVLKLLMALFINTFLKFFNNRSKNKKDQIEEADLNRIVKNQFIKKHTISTHSKAHAVSDQNYNTGKVFFAKRLFYSVKQFCLTVEHSNKFENFIMCVIILNIIVMTVDNPLLDSHGHTKEVIHILEMIFTAIYGVEIAIKMIACGLFTEGEGYFRDLKNLIDFLLFMLNMAGFLISSSIGFLNALRAFHIVVLSKHFESLRIILISLYQSLPYILKLLLFAFCFMLVFAVVPLRILNGKMNNCVTLNDTELALVMTKFDCLDLGGDWVRKDFHYDNIFFSLLNMFIIASCEGWSYFSIAAQDAVGSTHQPQSEHNRIWSVFFIVYYFISSIMVFNAFTGVMVQKFNEINDKFVSNQEVIPIKDKKWIQTKTSFKFQSKLTTEDQEWISIKRSVYHTLPIRTFEVPDPVKSRFRHRLYIVTSHSWWILFNDGCKILSTIVLSLHFHRSSVVYEDTLNIINDSLVLVFLIEIWMNVCVQKCEFFKRFSNIFEIIILISSLIPTINRLQNSSEQVNIIFRGLQALRVLRLINTFQLIKSIFSMMKFILPEVAPLAAVYFFTIYIYALFGMHLFAYIKPQQVLNSYDLHFRNFTSSVFTLIRISSGEQWFFIIADIVRNQQPNFVCRNISSYEEYAEHGLLGCGTYWGYLYFFTFHLIVSVIILNLLVAVLLGLIKTQNTAISKYQLSQIKDLWMNYDRSGHGFIDYKNFWQFTSRIAMVYGVKKDDLLDPNQKKNFLKFLSLPIYISKQNEIGIFGFRFHDVIVRMTHISLFLKYGIMPGGKEETKECLTQFYKELDESTKFKSEESSLLSGDIAVIILFQRRIKQWINRGRVLREAKIISPDNYEEVFQGFRKQSAKVDILSSIIPSKAREAKVTSMPKIKKMQTIGLDIIQQQETGSFKRNQVDYSFQKASHFQEINSENAISCKEQEDDFDEKSSASTNRNSENKIKLFHNHSSSLVDFANRLQAKKANNKS